MTDLIPAPTAELARVEPTTRDAAAEAVRLKGKAKADSTNRAYSNRWHTFTDWCQRQERPLTPLPADEATAALFIGYLSLQGCTPATVYGYTAAIRHHHLKARQPNPYASVDVQEVLEGHVRETGAAPSRVEPLRTNHIRRIISAMDMKKLADTRDRAMILTAFAGAFRRSELVTIRREHLHRDDGKGYRIWLPRSKGDQRGEGQWRFIKLGDNYPTCPATALDDWLARSGVTDGYVFRAIDRWDNMRGEGITPQVYATIIKKWTKLVGLDHAAFSGHSTRRGFATEGAEKKASRQQIMKDGGWKSNAVDVYIQAVEGYDEAVSGNLGL